VLKKLLNKLTREMCEQPTLARLMLDRAFGEAASHLRQGRVLEVGAGQHHHQRAQLPAGSRYFSLNLLSSEKPTVAGDATALPVQDGSVDVIIMLEVLEHVLHPQQVVAECHRVLAPGGTLIGSTRFIYPQHGAPSDYGRFTAEGLALVFGCFAECRIEKLGNRLHAVLDILSENVKILRIMNRALQYIRPTPSTCYSGLLVVARK
jgi:SAM-dependent methyltransferase